MHNIPEDVIKRRYVSGISNFFNIYKDVVDSWILVENYSVPRIVVANGGNDNQTKVLNLELYKKVQSYVR